MQYKYIKGAELIARVADGFTIDNSQWIYSAPLWIADAIDQLKIPTTHEYAREEIEVVGYKAQLPCDIKLLIAIEYDGMRLRRLGIMANLSAEGLAARNYSFDDSYELVGDGWITTSFEEGTIVVHYRRPPCDYDKVKDILIPKVPQDAYVIEAVKWFLLKNILYKGFKHPVFSLTGPEPVNPYLLWELNKKRARNSVNIIDADIRHEMSLLTRKFLQNYNSHEGAYFTGDYSKGGSNSGETTSSIVTAEYITNNYNTVINSNISKYVQEIAGVSTYTITASTHNLGANIIPVLYELVNGEYVKVTTTFVVDLIGNVTWTGSSVIDNGYIVLI